MTLPNADRCFVHESKIIHYLLDPDHEEGSSKANFFRTRGFRLDDWQGLADALIRHARTHEVVQTTPGPFGVKYAVVGPLPSPDGRASLVRVVWIIRPGEDFPRLISAYPSKGSR